MFTRNTPARRRRLSNGGRSRRINSRHISTSPRRHALSISENQAFTLRVRRKDIITPFTLFAARVFLRNHERSAEKRRNCCVARIAPTRRRYLVTIIQGQLSLLCEAPPTRAFPSENMPCASSSTLRTYRLRCATIRPNDCTTRTASWTRQYQTL